MYAYPTMDDIIARSFLALWFIGSILTIYFAGRIAERRGRSFKNWACIAGFLIGPLVFPLLFLLPSLHRKEPGDTEGDKHPTKAIGVVKRVIPGNPEPNRLSLSFSFR
jgi:MFS family permease